MRSDFAAFLDDFAAETAIAEYATFSPGGFRCGERVLD